MAENTSSGKMNESKNLETQTAEKTKTDSNTRSNDGIPRVVAEAFEAREGLAKEHENLKKTLEEIKELYARIALGGNSYVEPKKLEKEITPQEYAKLLIEGKLKT